MAKDDYFVVAYKILTYLYQCLKRGDKPEDSALTATAYQLNESYWQFIVESLVNECYLDGVTDVSIIGGERHTFTHDLRITPKGIGYLMVMDNPFMKKVENALKISVICLN
ncbi:MAG: YjcQ family protein [Streptococcaceae bacterium]|jgi:hypothetical protein|nr:YjcQ family protein [Streptococcaceae bacterium]